MSSMSDTYVLKRNVLIDELPLRDGLIKRCNEIRTVLFHQTQTRIDAKKFEPFYKHFIEILPPSIKEQFRDGKQTIDISSEDSDILKDIMNEIEFREESKQRRNVSNTKEVDVALSHTDPITGIDDNDNINKSVVEARNEPNHNDIYRVESQTLHDNVEDEKEFIEKRETKRKSQLRATAPKFNPKSQLRLESIVEENDLVEICEDVYHCFKTELMQIDQDEFIDYMMDDKRHEPIKELVDRKQRKLFANLLYREYGPNEVYYQVYDYIAKRLHAQNEKTSLQTAVKKTIINVEPFQPKDPGLRSNVYVSIDFTHNLAEYIEEEKWGKENTLLYKLLMYTFKCRVFDKLIKKISFSNDEELLIFPCCLQRRTDYKYLHIVMTPNNAKKSVKQQWRVPEGAIDTYCLSADELIIQYQLNEEDLPHPKRISSADLILDASYGIEVNMKSILGQCAERINKELEIESKDELYDDAFASAYRRAESCVKLNPRLAVPQLFVDKKHYRIELLLELKVKYPKGSKEYHTFALVLRKIKEEKKYKGMSILTLKMGYENARLIGYVDSMWLSNVRHRI